MESRKLQRSKATAFLKALRLFFAILFLIIGLSSYAQATPGRLDPSFGIGGEVTTAIGATDDEAEAVAVQPDGKTVVAGYSNTGTSLSPVLVFALARYNVDGSLDATFGSGGKVTTAIGTARDKAFALVIQPNGKIVAGGYSYDDLLAQDVFALVRYNADGSLDPTFGTGGKVTTVIGTFDTVFSLAIQADGKLVAGGYSYDNTLLKYLFALTRYNTDGTLDGTFGTGGKVTTPIGSDDGISSLIIQPDGKIVGAGYVYDDTLPLPQYFFALARYNTDGTLDGTFGTGGKVTTPIGTDDTINSLIIQPDGKLVAAGYAYDDTLIQYVFALARYNTDGTLDGTFGSMGKVTTAIGIFDDVPFALSIQVDGKLVAAGYSYDDTLNQDFFALIRYNTDGTLDTTFNPTATPGIVTTAFGTYSDQAFALAIQPDGKLVAAGYTTDITGTQYSFALARYLGGLTITIPSGASLPACLADYNGTCAFAPNPLTIESGDSVVWRNTDGAVPHNATSDDHIDNLVLTQPVPPGNSFSTALIAGGASSATIGPFVTSVMQTKLYHCSLHPNMKGTLIIIPHQNHPPVANSVEPTVSSTAPGADQTFTAVYSDPDGWQDIAAANLYFAGGGLHNEWLHYLVAPNLFTMLGTNSFCSPGQATTISNGFLTLDCAASGVSASGNVLTVDFVVIPQPSSLGMQYNIFSAVSDQYGASDAIFAGSWEVQNHPPRADGVLPMNSVTIPGTGQIFIGIYSDPDGWQDIAAANLYFAGGGLHNEWLHYLVAPNLITMLGTNNFCSPGQAVTLSNGFLTLDCAASSFSGSGSSLIVNFFVTPQPSSLGMQYNIFSAVSDQYGAATAIFAGSWGIQATTTTTTTSTTTSTTTTISTTTTT